MLQNLMSRRSPPDLLTTLRKLPLMDDLYLHMQAVNIAIVDPHLEYLESQLLDRYFANDRTPIPEMMFVSALSQMWVFAVYELLRTWRQRALELVEFGEELQGIAPARRRKRVQEKISQLRGASGSPALAMRQKGFRRVARTRYLERVKKALEQVTPVFRRIEALRVTIAKHEVPKSKGVTAFAPGYARIDMITGSITWQITLRDGTVDVLSRRAIADELRNVSRPRRPTT